MSVAAALHITSAKPQTSSLHGKGLLHRKCACYSQSPLSDICYECGSGAVQRKLAIGASNDPLEQEADRTADQVMATPAHSSFSGAPPRIQRSAAQSNGMGAAPTSVNQTLASPGRPLEPELRQDMEQRFGHDFSRVRVHSDAAAEQSARDVNAHAYTMGHDIAFGAGRFAPGMPEGRRLIAHELTHVVQQSRRGGSVPLLQRKGRGPGSCGLLDAAAATALGGAAHVQIQTRLLGRGLYPELPIPRATKTSGLSRRCMPYGTSFGFADVASIRSGLVEVSEIKPFYTAGILGRLEAQHYRLRADQSKQRLIGTGTCGKGVAGPNYDLDDVGFALAVGGISAASTFTLLKGAISGIEDFGPFSMDPKRNLKAKEVGTGAIGYWCTLNADGKKDKKKKDEKKKREKEAKKKERDMKKKSKKGDKRTKPEAKPKAGASAGGGNIGFGISIFSTSVGAGNAGIGISVGSSSAAVGTVGAGVSWFSDTAAAGAVGVGATSNSMGAAAGVAGAGVTEDSEGVAVGAAGAGTTKGVTAAGAGVAGVGEAEGSQTAAAGAAGKGRVKDSTIAGAGGVKSGEVEGKVGASTGSGKKPIDPKDVSGPGADKTPPGSSDEEVAGSDKPAGQAGKAAGAGQGDAEQGGMAGTAGGTRTQGDAGVGKPGGSGGGTGTPATMPGGDKEASQPGGKQVGGTPGGTATTAVPGAGTGTSELGVLPVFPFGASDAQREHIAGEAAKVAVLLSQADPSQKLLLEHLAKTGANGQYMVPTSDWIDRLLQATAGLTPDEIEYLKTLDWQPSTLTADQLRERIRKVLAQRGKPTTPASTAAGGEGKAAAQGDKGGGQGGGKGGGKGAGQGPGESGGAGTAKAGDKTAKKGGAGTAKAGDKTAKKGGAGTAKAGDKTAGEHDRATAPPAGSDRTTAGIFGFNFLSGLSASSTPGKGDVIRCSVSIDDQGRVFTLDDVSVTFYSRVETKTVEPDGTEQIEIVLNFYFTTDFWSEKNKFYGKGGPDSLTNIKFVKRVKKR